MTTEPAGSGWAETALSNPTVTLKPGRPHFQSIISALPGGVAGAIIVFLYCFSYAAVISQAELSKDVPALIWGFMISAAIAGVIAGSFSHLKPLGFAPDSAIAGLLASLGANIAASVKAAGGSAAQMTIDLLMALWLTGLLTGAITFVLGYFRVARFFRFVPYSVVAGFLGATGFMLLYSAISFLARDAHGPTDLTDRFSFYDAQLVAASVAFAAFVWLLQVSGRGRLYAISAVVAAAAFGLLMVRLTGSTTSSTLYLSELRTIEPWAFLPTALNQEIDWKILAMHLPQMAAVVVVAQLSNVVKVSTMEVQRREAGNLDAEFRNIGAGALAAAIFGGFGTSISTGVSRVLSRKRDPARLGGIITAILAGALLVLKIHILNVVPLPILSGLALYLGVTLLSESFRRPLLERSWLDFIAALLIMLICIRWGHLAGIAAGIILASVLFSYNYAKAGPIKRHTTASSLSSHVVRKKELASILRREGEAIDLYWISGYLFFGSSDRLFEQIRTNIEKQPLSKARYVILDMSEITGMDSSAAVSLIKLRNYCAQNKVHLLFCGAGKDIAAKLKAEGVPAQLFTLDWTSALAWSETSLLSAQGVITATVERVETWLAEELGPQQAEGILPYFGRHELKPGDLLYRQGEPADTIDLVAAGSVGIVLKREDGRDHQLRLMETQTLVGEMGFFRNAVRAASVVATEDAIIYSMTRESFTKLERENPDAALAFLHYVVRTLADRVDLTNRETAALL